MISFDTDKEACRQFYEELFKAEQDRLNEQYNVITSLGELSGWTILELERFKPGVVRFHACMGNFFKIGYAKDEVFYSVQLPA